MKTAATHIRGPLCQGPWQLLQATLLQPALDSPLRKRYGKENFGRKREESCLQARRELQ